MNFRMRNILIVLGLFPLFLIGQENLKWEQVDAGGEFSLGIQSDSSLYSWGLGIYGQLANGDASDKPVLEAEKVTNFEDWISVSAGAFHALAVKDSGSIYGWGYNGYSSIDSLASPEEEVISEPVMIGNKTNWKEVHAGLHTSYAINNKGHLYGWGRNNSGQTGHSAERPIIHKPEVIDSFRNWEKIVTGHNFALFLDDNGMIYGTGSNRSFQLTSNFGEFVDSLVLLDSFNIYNDIAANYASAHAVRDDGALYSWGSNIYFESGVPGEDLFLEVISPTDFQFDYGDIYCGSVYCLIEKDDEIFGWGTNILGAVGIGNPKSIEEPRRITTRNDWENIAVSIGLSDGLEIYGGHTLWLPQNEDYYCGSGANYVGQLGNGVQLQNQTVLQCNIGEISTSVTDPEVLNNVKVYPNPASNRIFIEYNNNDLNSIRIYSTSGKLMNNIEVNNSQLQQIELGSLQNGIYFLQLITKDGNTAAVKIVKQ